MQMTDLIAEIERRADEARGTVQGPDYNAIVTDVAEQARMDPKDLHRAWVDSWLMGAN